MPEIELRGYTNRIIDGFLSNSLPPKKIGFWFEGKFYTAYSDKSQSRCGVRYNRLIRLSVKVKKANQK